MDHIDEVITYLQHKEEQQAKQPKQLDIFDVIENKTLFVCENETK